MLFTRVPFLPTLTLAAALTTTLSAQSPEIYSNGPLITHPGAGPIGEDVSSLENTTLGLSVYGHGSQTTPTVGNRLADDFYVNGTWVVDGIELFAYQTGTLSPSITSVFVEIYTSDPSLPGATILPGSPGIANDLFVTPGYAVTNTMANINRTLESTGQLTNNRPIQSVRIDFPGAPLLLDPAITGTSQYWIEFSFTGSGASGPWVPPVTCLNVATTGDGLQNISLTTGWQSTLSGPAATPFNQGLPFKLFGPPISAPGAITNLGGGCSAATLEVRGAPHVGGFVQAELTGVDLSAFAMVILGFSDPNLPLGVCSCTQHAALNTLNIPADTYSLQIPNVAAGLGLTFYLQGAQLDLLNAVNPPLGCDIGIGLTFELTDGYQVRLY
jgi:hypothetical protein